MDIEIQYHDKTVEKLCTDLRKARRELPAIVAEKLHALINLIESVENLRDIANMQMYHLHALQGKRKGQFALDIAGRRAGYRLVIIPIGADGKTQENEQNMTAFESTQVVIVWEVTNHYE